jgi:hypothetical protein
MSDPDITRDILRGAIEKHADEADDEALARTVRAARGVALEAAQHDAEQARQPDHTEPIASTRPTTVLGARLSGAVLDELKSKSPKRLAERYKHDE